MQYKISIGIIHRKRFVFGLLDFACIPGLCRHCLLAAQSAFLSMIITSQPQLIKCGSHGHSGLLVFLHNFT